MRKLALTIAASTMLAATFTANAGPIYLTDVGEPWGHTTNIENFDAAFGAGNWDRMTFGDAGIFNDTNNFLYVDGGDGATAGFQSWINANRTNIESFVAAGGSVFLNAARWGGTAGFDLGFGVTLTEDAFSSSCTLLGDQFGAAGTVFTGNGCAHDSILGAGLTDLVTGAGGKVVMAEMAYGAGHIMFGGMTTTGWQSPNGFDIRVNMLKYGAEQINAVPEPASLALLGLGLVGFGFSRKRKAA